MFEREVLAALGQVVINAAGLETALAVFAGERLGLNGMDTMGKPGAALKAARRATNELDNSIRASFVAAVDEAEFLLQRRHEFIHAMWSDTTEDNLPGVTVIHMRTFRRVDVSVEILNSFSADLSACSSKIIRMLTALINNWPVTDARP